jgi:hypothetical protein
VIGRINGSGSGFFACGRFTDLGSEVLRERSVLKAALRIGTSARRLAALSKLNSTSLFSSHWSQVEKLVSSSPLIAIQIRCRWDHRPGGNRCRSRLRD